MSEEKTRFTLRIDTELFEIVKKNAKCNCRSAAMEIEYALNRYYLVEPLINVLLKNIPEKATDVKEEDLSIMRAIILENFKKAV